MILSLFLTCLVLSGFKRALLQNHREMIRGQIFSGMIRIRARKPELQAESRSYRPKVRDTAQNPNRIAQERAQNGVQVLLQKPPLKPS